MKLDAKEVLTKTRFARSKPEATIMTITPEVAAELLATSPGNRRKRGWYIDLLASAMKRGEWRVTSQGIGIDINGHLRDAHHRLSACVQAGVPIQSVVVFGMSISAFEVIDTNLVRTLADRMTVDQREAEVFRLAGTFVFGTNKPTVEQLHPLVDAGLGDATKTLLDYCGAARKFYSSAGMKLAACVSLMNGGRPDFILGQYRALCVLDFDVMVPSAKALIRQVEGGKISATQSREVLARGLRVFDEDRANVQRIQVSDADTTAAVSFTRAILERSLEDYEPHTS